MHSGHVEEEFEDTKGVIRIRISQRNRQHNGQRKWVYSLPANNSVIGTLADTDVEEEKGLIWRCLCNNYRSAFIHPFKNVQCGLFQIENFVLIQPVCLIICLLFKYRFSDYYNNFSDFLRIFHSNIITITLQFKKGNCVLKIII